MRKTNKIIGVILAVVMVLSMVTVGIVSSFALAEGEIYTVAGSSGLCGSDWDPADTNNQMTWIADEGVYEIEYTNVAAGYYEFKVVKDLAWDASGNWNLDGDAMYGGANAYVNVEEDGSTVVIGFNGMHAYVEIATDATEDDTASDDEISATDDEQDTTDVVIEGDGINVYFTNNKGWSTVYIYYWDGCPAEWPGVEMTFVETNGYGEDIYGANIPANVAGVVFNGGQDQPQTVDVTDVQAGYGYYCDGDAANEEGKWNVGSYVYEEVEDNTTDVTDATTEATDATDATEATDATTEATEATDATTEATEATDATTEVVDGEAGVIVNGKTYEVAVGDEITYVIDLTAGKPFENIQATVSYDSAVLELVRYTSDDPFVEDWEIEGPIACPNLEGVIFNAGIDNIVKLNASKVAGYNFRDGANLVTLKFIVKENALTTISTVIEEMTIKGGNDSYFAGGQAVVTDDIVIDEYLIVPEKITTTVATEDEVTTAEPTTAEDTTAEDTTAEDTTAEDTTAEDTTAENTTAENTTAEDTTATDVDGTEDTTADGTNNGAMDTGAAAYIYVVLAVLTMAACAVVVIRKRVNG